MSNNDRMVSFRIHSQIGSVEEPGERCYMRVSTMMCLFPEHRQIRTIEHGWTVVVCKEDWQFVERAFRAAYLGNPVHAARGLEQGLTEDI